MSYICPFFVFNHIILSSEKEIEMVYIMVAFLNSQEDDDMKNRNTTGKDIMPNARFTMFWHFGILK